MFVRTKPIANSSRKRVQICECRRVDGKVKQKVVQHVGIAENDDHLEELLKLARVRKLQILEEKKGPFLFDLLAEQEAQPEILSSETLLPAATQEDKSLPSADEAKQLVNIKALKEESRVVDGFHDIFGTLFNQLGLHHILKSSQREVLRDVLLARIACPVSKAATQQILATDFGREIDLDRIYRMMDALVEQKETVLQKVFIATEQLCFGKVDVLLFDVTTLYFESTETDELRSFGYSKDQKFHSVQVVLALATAPNGLPIGYRLFPGNTADVSSLVAAIEEWKKILPIGEIRLVADRAMMSEKNLAFLEEHNIQYVVAAKLRKLAPSASDEILNYRKEKSGIVLDRCTGKRRLIVTFCQDRQNKDEKDRKRILEKITKKMGNGKNAKKLVSNSGYQKFISCHGDAKLFLDEEKIAQDARWDGFHGVITNCAEERAEELLSQYKRLWVIEESFRIQKHNLCLRPIYHFKPERIEAHILICYLAFALMRHLEFRVRIQKEEISMKEMREELWRVQSSYLRDLETNKIYRLPSAMSVKARKIYQVMGIKRLQIVQAM